VPSLAATNTEVDCPLRTAPYSVDSPLIDILLKPEAKAALEEALPDFPAARMSTSPPTFSAIVTLRALAEFVKVSHETLSRLDSTLSRLSVTPADEDARCARYDVAVPDLNIPDGKLRILLFEKINGFRDAPSVEAAHQVLLDLAARQGWSIVATDKGGAISPKVLKKFDAVVWSNVSGDVLTLTQREAFQHYIESGGGFVGLHGSGGDPVSFWDWYSDTLIGARFAGHPMNPQFQQARVMMTVGANGIGAGLPQEWQMKDEWYSFSSNPRAKGASVIAALDESSYSPKDMTGKDLRMGDHPIVWTRCVGDGRAFYSAIGHMPETYVEPHHQVLLEQAIRWAAGEGSTKCRNGEEVRTSR
jgi:type 1 glutamine amidotransferase